MNPIHWLFARLFHNIHTLKPDAIVEQLPVAALIALNVLLLTPIIQAVMLVEMAFNISIGTPGTVALWLIVSAVNYYLLLGQESVAQVLSRYPAKPTSKGRAMTFFSALVLLTLLMSWFPISGMLRFAEMPYRLPE
ncbi:hypothetical protein ACFQT0_12325 [Hymenobacter humi]|uniref:Uncharacterized protein n=1 Tax=Hymenobacter humi TaxID=1411620 RepID=A0ABW2U7L6_9BACT